MIPEIIEDLTRIPIVMVAERGHSKSTSLKTVLMNAKSEMGEGLVLKVLDISQSWFWSSPCEYRQSVTVDLIKSDKISNIGSCVFEVGQLSRNDRRAFLSTLVKADFDERYDLVNRYGPQILKDLPMILYVLEEASTYLDSYSLRKADKSSEILSDFVQVGRNYKMNFIAVCTAMSGELSPSIRRRSALLVGRCTGSGELAEIKRRTNKEIREIVKTIPRFHWLYWSGGLKGGIERIRDECTNTPQDFNPIHVKKVNRRKQIEQVVGLIAGLSPVWIWLWCWSRF